MQQISLNVFLAGVIRFFSTKGARTKLLAYIERRNKKTTSTNNGTLTGLQEYIRSAVTSDVKYTVGPAGTGQPSVTYPALCFEPAAVSRSLSCF